MSKRDKAMTAQAGLGWFIKQRFKDMDMSLCESFVAHIVHVIRTELDSRQSAPVAPPSGDVGGPAPVPCPQPFGWCANCGAPAGSGHKRGCDGLYDYTPTIGGPAPSPDTAPAAEPPQAPGGLATMEELRSWMKAHGASELKPEPPHAQAPRWLDPGHAVEALVAIRDTIRKTAASDGIVLNLVRQIADRALYLPVPNDYIPLIDDTAEVKRLRAALREIRDTKPGPTMSFMELAWLRRKIAVRALDE